MTNEEKIQNAISLLKDNYIIIEIPKGVSKDNRSDKDYLASLYATKYGYKPTKIKKTTGLVFTGTDLEFETETSGKEIAIITKENDTNGSFIFTYEIHEEIQVNETVYGLGKALLPLLIESKELAFMDNIKPYLETVSTAEEAINAGMSVFGDAKTY